MADADRWSMDAAVAEMTDAGAFGPGCAFVSYEPDDRLAGQDQFATVVRFGTATVSDGRGPRRRHALVIKFKQPRALVREFLRNDLQFHNEMLFYERAVPFLLDCAPADRAPSVCRYFYGRNDCGALASRDMIVLENSCAPPRNYRLSESRLDLDIDHVLVALRTLAKFHGLSYNAKHKHPAKFSDLVAGFKDTQWYDDQWMRGIATEELFSLYLNKQAERDRHGSDEQARQFRAEILSDVNREMRRLMEPVEPLAVLCHGDFNRNNLMFRYDENGKPVDALPFDMATVRYGSPALDLSFFLYMNTDRRLRDAHWDLMLDEYCAELAAAVSDLARESVPGRAQIDVEMREHAFYGLAHVSFFLRFMMEESKQLNMLEFVDLEDFLPSLLSYGGDRATDRIADVVQHFLHVRYAKSTPF